MIGRGLMLNLRSAQLPRIARPRGPTKPKRLKGVVARNAPLARRTAQFSGPSPWELPAISGRSSAFPGVILELTGRQCAVECGGS